MGVGVAEGGLSPLAPSVHSHREIPYPKSSFPKGGFLSWMRGLREDAWP